MLQQVESRTSPWPPAMPPAAAERTSADWTSILEMDVQATWSSAGDSRQGHDYMHARFYSPQMARFFSVDPVLQVGRAQKNPQFWNRYAYTANNPLVLVDPTGEAAVGRAAAFLRGEDASDCEGFFNCVKQWLLQVITSDPTGATGLANPVGVVTTATRATAAAQTARAATRSGATATEQLLPAGSRVPNAGGTIRSLVTSEEQVFYRVFSGESRTGGFLVRARPVSRELAVEGLALPPGNEAQFIQDVIVPASTRLQRLRALPAFGRRGGLEQFELLNEIPESAFGPRVPLP